MSLIPFDFDGLQIRVELAEDGEPWFVAKDVCDALGLTTDATRRLDEDEKGLRSVQTPGGSQDMTCLSESGLYSLVLGSRVDGARRFKRWVTKDVLPAIRRTGNYSKPDARPALRDATEAAHNVLLLAGVRPGLASAAMLAVIEKHTGIAMETARLSLPAEEKPLASLNATAVGKLLGLSGIKANKLLEARGLQSRDERGDWVPTEAGKRLGGELIAFDNRGHQGLQLRWPATITEALQ